MWSLRSVTAVQRTSGPPRHGRAPLGALLAIALAALLSLPAGAAAEIVYTHGQPQPQLPVGGGYTPSRLVAMGDGGSDQHVLLNPSQVASDQLLLCCASLQPNSSTMVFNGFDFQNNIWEIPASCNQCAFPAAAKQLTTDGTSSVPDTNPAWTSETVTAPGRSTPPPAAAKLKLTLRVAAAQKVVAQKGLGATVECNVACAIAVVGGVQLQGARKALLTATLARHWPPVPARR